MTLQKIIYFITTIFFINVISIDVFTCNGCCSCCPCCNHGGKKLNKYCFLDGYIDIETVEKKRSDSLNIIAKIEENGLHLTSYKNYMVKCKINNTNKITFYINFAIITYVLNLVYNMLNHINSNSEKLKKKIEKENTQKYISEVDNKITKIFSDIVNKGEEIDANDLVIEIRQLSNNTFNKSLDTLDSLTGYETDFT